MFDANEDSNLRNKVRQFVKTEMIPVEKIRTVEENVPNETIDSLRLKLRQLGITGESWVGEGNITPSHSIIAVYEELHRSLLGFWGAGVIDGTEIMTSFPGTWTNQLLHEGVYPVTKMKWFETNSVQGRVRISGSFTAVGSSRCGWFWIDSEQVLINRSSSGVSIHLRKGMGMLDVSDIILDNVEGEQLSKEKTYVLNPNVVLWYLRLGAGAVGCCLRAIEEAVAYSKVRVAFGKPLSDHQAIQWMIADMMKDVQAVRWRLYESSEMLARDPFSVTTQELAVLAGADAISIAILSLDHAIQIFGGKGYTRSFWLEEAFRNLVGYQAMISADQVYKEAGMKIRQQGYLFL
ncbi:acyl-CoA dehydrogenase family protein [Peribacillus frigoritolerans]|uniref:acyl-CoA dehydrogenase family protein n=1 Tax=Peribacillus frigoritolerans TaxID=450367 RepID=UPI0021D22897|nr:acyl-CoA dehydrogenase family protein [Peribacillus frigoritolerans]MCU6598970.1 acyl-CoA dehydrogenase family protein [Peribacillus frigoritolerans]